MTRLRCAALVTGLTFGSVLPAAAANWPVFGHDPARSSVDGSRPILTVRNVGRLHSRWQTSLGAVADSSPIYLEAVEVGGMPRPMLFQTASNGTTFGIDAASGRIRWRFRTQLASPASERFSPLSALRKLVFGAKVTNSTPGADPSGRAIYAPGLDGFVHKLDAASGKELRGRGFPLRLTSIPQTEKNASALNVANGYLYATTSGYNGDVPPYDGHVVSVRLRDGMTTVRNALCSKSRVLQTASSCPQSGSGIWSRGGAVVDPDKAMHGQVYVATGNGHFDASTGGQDFGDSVLAFSADLSTPFGNYTPSDYETLDHDDADLGSTSPTLLPRQPASRTPLMLVQGGKDSVLRLVNRLPLPGVAGELQTLTLPGPLFSTPAVWSDSSRHVWVFMGFSEGVDAYQLATDARGTSRLVRKWRAPAGKTEGEGTSPVVSNGIVFDALDGAIFALDARTGRELWNSALHDAGRTIGAVHWQSPIVVNGWLYCSDQDGNLTAYALR